MSRFTLKGLLLIITLLCGVASSKAQDVRISEFLALNTTGIQDEDATPQGWVELWNPSRTAKVIITNWKLASGTSQWTFPSTEIPPNDRLLVWASGKNRVAPTAPLHTNFTLDSAGGTLRLIRSNGTTASEYVNYPAQTANVSYGADQAQTALVGFYTSPTPESPNTYVGTGVAGHVIFSVQSQAYTAPFTLELSQAEPAEGAEIRYTTDGSVPLSTSTLYTAPITVSTTAQVRARVFQPGKLPGETESQCYLLVDSSITNFSSKIPVVVLTNFNAGKPVNGSSNPPENPGYAWVFEPVEGTTRITNTPKLHGRIAMDLRGSSTEGNAKYNLNIEFRRGRADEERDVSLLGMPSHSDWVFHAPFNFDRSLVHNPFMYALSNSIGRYATRTKMAEVFIKFNTGTSPTLSYATTNDPNNPGFPVAGYMGVYNIMEKIRRGKDRVDIRKLDRYDNDPVKKTGGYIVKVDRRDAGDAGFATASEASLAYYYPKEVDLLSPQRDPQEQYVRKLFSDFDAAKNNRDPVTGYRKYLDVPAAIDHHLMNVWSFNVDALRLSGYMHINEGGKITYGPIWDFDRALSSTDGRDANPAVWRSTVSDLGTDFFNYTWWNRLFSDPDFYQSYIDRWVELRRGPFSPTAVNALLDQMNNEITPEAATRDLARWNQTKRSWTSPFGGGTTPGQLGEIKRIKDWLQQRANFMDSQWVTPVTISKASGKVDVGTTVEMTAGTGSVIYYTTDGSDPRPSGGAVPTAANTNVQIYSGPITIATTTRIRARAYKATHVALKGANNPPIESKWSGRTDARFSVDAPAAAESLIVTELNYHPADPTATELAVNPLFTEAAFEFVEVKNVGSVPIDLAGAQFTTGITFAFTGENAISLAPGEIAIVAANPDGFKARYGAKPNVLGPFKGDLSNAGEQLLLVAANGEKVLDFTYSDQWYTTSDGGGQTLVVYNQAAPEAAYSTNANWRASGAIGGSPGSDEPPAVATLAASDVTATSVLLKASVTPNGTTTALKFVLSIAGGEEFNVEGGSVLAGVDATELGPIITGLMPHTTYTFRAEATNGGGLRVGEPLTFTTLNRPPVVQDKTLPRSPLPVDVLGAASDPDGDALSVSAVTPGQHGSVRIDENKLVYTPNPGATGDDSFTYTVSDEFGGSAIGTITVTNTAPVTVADTLAVTLAPGSLDPRANDSDPNGDSLVVSAVTQGSVGTVTITDGTSVTYTPGPQFFGSDTFSYTVTDGTTIATGTVTVYSTVPIAVAGPAKGAQIPGQPTGTVFGTIDSPKTGVFSGTAQSGKTKQKAIFAADGSVLLKVGDLAPELTGATLVKLGNPSGQAVIATIKGAKGSGISTGNDTVLYTGLGTGSLRVAAREGDTLGGATIKSFLSVDGNGDAVYFLAKLGGGGVNASNDVALAVVLPDVPAPRLLAREGDVVDGRAISAIGTLVSSAGTTAEGRWRSGADAIGVRLTFSGKQQALYTIPANAISSAEWKRWAGSADVYPEAGTAQSFGLPGFGPEAVAFVTQLVRAPGVVSATNDTALLRRKGETSTLLAAEGKTVRGMDGNELAGLTFKKLSDPVAGADGRVAFAGTVAGSGVKATNQSGLWISDAAGAVRMLARAGDQAPGGGRWSAFESLVFPDGAKSGPLFTGKLATDISIPKGSRGLWAVDGTGSLQVLLRTGLPITVNGASRTVKSFVALTPTAGSLGAASGFDDTQRVTALVSFTDGTQSLVDIMIP